MALLPIREEGCPHCRGRVSKGVSEVCCGGVCGGAAVMTPSYIAPDPFLLLLTSVSCVSALCVSEALAVLTSFSQ